MRRFLWFTVVCVALYAGVGFFALPPILKTQLERRGAVELGRSVSIGRVRVNPFALSVTLDGVEVGGRGGAGAPLLGWQRLHVNFDPLASLTDDWAFGEIALSGSVVAGGRIFIAPEARQTGMVFQEHALFPHMTVEQNVGYGINQVGNQQIDPATGYPVACNSASLPNGPATSLDTSSVYARATWRATEALSFSGEIQRELTERPRSEHGARPRPSVRGHLRPRASRGS